MRIKEKHFDSWGFALSITTRGYDEDNSPMNLLHVHVGKFNYYIEIPPIFSSKEEKVYPNWNDDTVKRLGRNYYINYTPKRYGFSFSDDYLHTYYGIQPGSWTRNDPENSDHTKLIAYPWNLTFVRSSVYYTDGSYMCNHDYFSQARYDYDGRYGELTGSSDEAVEARLKLFLNPLPVYLPISDIPIPNRLGVNVKTNYSSNIATLPIYKFFTFIDPYDQKSISAKCHIVEREWHRGIYAPLRFIMKCLPYGKLIRRDLDIEFSEEVGSRKNSWKGGTTGMGYSMKKGETIDQAWIRFITDDKELAYFKR
jgi:hypothetical protein